MVWTWGHNLLPVWSAVQRSIPEHTRPVLCGTNASGAALGQNPGLRYHIISELMYGMM